MISIIHILLSQNSKNSDESIDNFEGNIEHIEEGVPIHWDLLGLDQDDPKLIEAIKSKVLWRPPPQKYNYNLKFPNQDKILEGQYEVKTLKNIYVKAGCICLFSYRSRIDRRITALKLSKILLTFFNFKSNT